MLAAVDSRVLAGLEARRVEVHSDSANGDTKFYLLGLAATPENESPRARPLGDQEQRTFISRRAHRRQPCAGRAAKRDVKLRRMIFLQMLRSDLPPGDHQAALKECIAGLPEGFRPLLAEMRRVQAEILGISVEAAPPVVSPLYGGRSNVVAAEIVSDGENLFLVQLLNREDGARRREGRSTRDHKSLQELQICAMAAQPSTPRLDEVATLVDATFKVKLTPFQYRSNRFDELLKEGRSCPITPSAEEMKTVRRLADKAVRAAAIGIKASLGLLVSDLPKQLPPEARGESDRIRKDLLEAGLVQSEIVVICKKTSGQIARFPTQAVIELASDQGVKCACGRLMRDERCEEALAISQTGSDLLEHSRWFSLLLLDELLRLGIPIERITLEHQAGGDEMDCLADVSGELLFFELKDKEFSLGNAYSFGAKIGLLRPKHSVIVTTESVGGDAKDHFQRAEAEQRRSRTVYMDPDDYLIPSAQSPITYIEGLDHLRTDLADLLTMIYSQDAVRLLSDAAGFGSASPQSLLRAVRQPSVPNKTHVGANGARKAKAPI